MRRKRAPTQVEKDRKRLEQGLAEWGEDEELFYADRARWRQTCRRFLISEAQADDASREPEERQVEHLRAESGAFLARQMDEMRALAEEQCKAGPLLDDDAPVCLAISAVEQKGKEEEAGLIGPVFEHKQETTGRQ
ncbi:unnamed protein product [Rhizoctonia solani]|uniref:Uncharacterized protein n=1 Tax=Rhizoctonia solani TaxID=456999 RepID=A0A8H3E542_9AGAM|nr:unnamed protein product [Rhizoctonia solani]